MKRMIIVLATAWMILINPSVGYAAGQDGANVATGLMQLGDDLHSGLVYVATGIVVAGICIGIGVVVGCAILSRRKRSAP